MHAVIRPGTPIAGETRVPGDKSIAHRWLILAATAEGTSTIRGLPRALDVRSTARCLDAIGGDEREALGFWADNPRANPEDHGFTWDSKSGENDNTDLVIEGEGWAGLQAPNAPLNCENSGTTMRLLMGALAGTDFNSTLVGDEALTLRPMERVAEPLRLLGADIDTDEGHAPVRVAGTPLKGATIDLQTPSSQVKSALLLAGLQAAGTTRVIQRTGTRDHTERALIALGAPVEIADHGVTVSPFQHAGFDGDIPGDPSSALFLVAAAALTGGELSVSGVGLNESRIGFLSVLDRLGVIVKQRPESAPALRLGEPAGNLDVNSKATIRSVTVAPDEIPGIIDDILMLAVVSAFAPAGAESRFEGAGELRLKESDRLAGAVAGIRGLGGRADLEGDTLIVHGGGLDGGVADAMRDHRLAMAFAVGALAARRESRIDGIEWADVSFPGFIPAIRFLGAEIKEG